MSAAPLPGPKLVTTKVRGNIIKVPDATPGLLMINHNQRQFTLEGVWKSATAPAPNQTVDVELDEAGNVTGISVVDPAQIARERFHELSGKVGGKLGEITQGQGKDAVNIAKEFLRKLTARVGAVTLGATVLLWISLFFLPGYKFDLGFIGSQTYTLWDFIGLKLTMGGGTEISHGFWGLIGIVAILAPIVVPFIPNPLAKFGNALPLAYLAIAILMERSSIAKVIQVAGVPDTGLGLSMQIGTYLALACSLLLAAMILKPSSQER
jgi:hypothetical protein